MASKTEEKQPAEEKEAPAAKRPKSKYQGKTDKDGEAVFYIVNRGGAVHTVTRANARARLAQVGYRLATDEEIKEYLERPVQRHKNPIAPPWTPEPDLAIELEE